MLIDFDLQVDDAPQPTHLSALLYYLDVLKAPADEQEDAVKFWLQFHEPGSLLKFQLERAEWITS